MQVSINKMVFIYRTDHKSALALRF